MKKVNKKRLSNILNIIIFAIAIIIWGSIFILRGIAGSACWTALIMIISPIASVLLIIALISIIIGLIKKKSITKKIITALLLGILAFPVLALLNVMPIKYPANIEKAEPSLTIMSPFEEPAVTVMGGDTVKDNSIHVIWPSERWAYDIVMEPYDVGSSNLDDYGIYEQKVFSPVDGVVIAAHDKETDILPNTEEFTSMHGNYVYIEVNQTQTYLLLVHFKHDSISVKAGDIVKCGDFLGLIGNSGTTSEPHLHIHHQKQNPLETIFPTVAQGLPLYFYDENKQSYMPTASEIITP